VPLQYHGSIVAIGEGPEVPAENATVSVHCRPAGSDLISVAGDGVVQTVTQLSDGNRRFEVIVHVREPFPDDVLHWTVADWRIIPWLPESFGGSKTSSPAAKR